MRNCYKYFVAIYLGMHPRFCCHIANLNHNWYCKKSRNREGIPAVSIEVNGTTMGTFTDDKGNFKINVNKLPATLIFSSIGYATKEITVTNAGEQSIELEQAFTLGTEVVVGRRSFG